MLADLSTGFIEHGHMCGVWAITAAIDDDPASIIDPTRVCDLSRANPYAAVYLLLTGKSNAAAAFACGIADRIIGTGVRVVASVRPGVMLPSDRLAYESILRITEGDIPRAAHTERFDDRVASVSIHAWPGSGLLNRIDKDMPLSCGRYLFLTPPELGDAKVWLHGERVSRWRVLRSHPLNDLESAELDEQAAGTRY